MSKRPSKGCGSYGATSQIFQNLDANLPWVDVLKYNKVYDQIKDLPYMSNYLSELDMTYLMAERHVP